MNKEITYLLYTECSIVRILLLSSSSIMKCIGGWIRQHLISNGDVIRIIWVHDDDIFVAFQTRWKCLRCLGSCERSGKKYLKMHTIIIKFLWWIENCYSLKFKKKRILMWNSIADVGKFSRFKRDVNMICWNSYRARISNTQIKMFYTY